MANVEIRLHAADPCPPVLQIELLPPPLRHRRADLQVRGLVLDGTDRVREASSQVGCFEQVAAGFGILDDAR